MSVVLAQVLDVLRCPICAEPFEAEKSALRCVDGHAFDVARQGYVNLLTGSPAPGTADTANMVQARAEFLAAGHYAQMAEALATRVAAHRPNVVLDAGAGTGYFLAYVLNHAPDSRGVALDISTYAARRAARAHPRAAAAVCDTWRSLPIHDRSVDVLVNVFAPRNGPEFARALRPDGVLLVVTPTAQHLAELVHATGMLKVDARKDVRLERSLAGDFEIKRRSEVTFSLSLTPVDVERVIRMGPSAWHLDETEVVARVADLGDVVTATASVVITTYRRRPPQS